MKANGPGGLRYTFFLLEGSMVALHVLKNNGAVPVLYVPCLNLKDFIRLSMV